MKKLLLVTSGYFHLVGHRIHHIIEPLKKEFDVKIVALAPTSYNRGIKRNTNTGRAIFKFLSNLLSNNICIVNATDKAVLIKTLPLPLVTLLLVCNTIQKLTKTNEFDVCLVSDPYMGFATLLAKPKFPVVYEDLDRFEYFAKNKLSKLFLRIIERTCLKKATHIICVGYSLATSAKQIRNDNNVSCIPNGVNLEIFNAALNENIPRENIMVYVGTIDEWSGLDLVISSVRHIRKEIPDVHLMIVGSSKDTGYMKRLTTLVDRLGLKSYVHFLGRRRHTEIPKILAKCRIGLAVYPVTNLMKYAFTLKIPEYMAAGLPVVTTNVGDGAAIIKFSTAGLVIHYDEISLSKAVVHLLKDRELWRRMSQSAIKYSEKFSWEKLAKSQISILNHVTENHKIDWCLC